MGKITYHKVILLCQPRTDFLLSFLRQVLQLSPVSGGWMPTHSCPTRQHRAQWSTLKELKSSQKNILSDHQHPLQRSPLAGSTGQHEMGRWKHETRWEHERHTGRIQLREGYFPTNPLFFPDQQVTASPNSPRSTSSPVHTA